MLLLLNHPFHRLSLVPLIGSTRRQLLGPQALLLIQVCYRLLVQQKVKQSQNYSNRRLITFSLLFVATRSLQDILESLEAIAAQQVTLEAFEVSQLKASSTHIWFPMCLHIDKPF